MDKSKKKRDVPPVLAKILTMDIYFTNQFVKFIERFLAFRQLRTHYKLLEISCHGLVWIPFWIAFIWIFSSKNLYQMQINFFIGLILDIVIIAVIKAIVRRRRPVEGKDLTAYGPDKYSFPSGHTSRSFYVLFFFLYNWPVYFIFVPPLLCWSISVSISRILMRRHYILDVVTGAILGLFLSFFIGLIYLDKETCTDIIWWITEEKLDGGEYHV